MDAEQHGTAIPLRDGIELPLSALSWSAVRAQGAGGQNVNKVASAIHLRFDVRASPLPEEYKTRLLECRDRRMSSDGVLVIKAQRFRTQESNLRDALERLQAFILANTEPRRPRRPTRPSLAAKRRRVDEKVRHGRLKRGRRLIED
jgi:ribosome-associated protein